MMSIKTVKFLRYLITQNQKLPSTLAGEVASLSQKAHPEPQEKGQVLFFQILPQLLLFLQVFLCPGFDGQDRTNGHHDFQVLYHVVAQLPAAYLHGVIIPQHQLGDPNLLVNAANHHLFVDGLVLPSDVIAVEIHIQVINMLHMRQGLVHKNIVHIKGVFGKLQTALDKQPCP